MGVFVLIYFCFGCDYVVLMAFLKVFYCCFLVQFVFFLVLSILTLFIYSLIYLCIYCLVTYFLNIYLLVYLSMFFFSFIVLSVMGVGSCEYSSRFGDNLVLLGLFVSFCCFFFFVFLSFFLGWSVGIVFLFRCGWAVCFYRVGGIVFIRGWGVFFWIMGAGKNQKSLFYSRLLFFLS